jgi:ABC-type sugar transport system ATPase subunit
MNRIVIAAVLASATVFGAGCNTGDTGASPASRAERVQETSLAQLGELLHLREQDAGRPAEKAADLAKYEKAFPVAFGKVKAGEIVVLAAPIDAGATDQVLAYEKQAAESGGYVLLRDGTTIKKMTADEFKAAQKAQGATVAADKK